MPDLTPSADPAAGSHPQAVPILEMRDISKTFGAIRALSGVSLTVYPGEVHALMGENGAGKSTLMKILSGAYTPDPGGAVLVNGQTVPPGDPVAAKRAGISIIYQELSLSPNLTVAQNMYLGNEFSRWGILNKGEARRAAAPILQRLGAPFGPGVTVADLSLGNRQLVEIGRSLTIDARILVMDEPTTSLTAREVDRLFGLIASLKEQGMAIIYISHRMEEVYQLADRVSVLRDGTYVGTLEHDQISAAKLVSMMVGRDLSSFYRKQHRAGGKRAAPLMSVQGMGDGKRVFDASFDLYPGEVLGIAGLVGSGRTELARLIYGADPATGGRLTLHGQEKRLSSPAEALEAGVAYLTEDRKGLGLFLDMSVAENINISVIGRDAKAAGVRDYSRADQRANDAVKAFGIRTAGTRINVGALSGGNQQKTLLARLLEGEPGVLILDEPTRGVDVGAKSEIYRMIDALAQRGLGIVVISSDLPEIIGIADRVLVMREGRIAGEVLPDAEGHIDQEDIMTLATSASAPRAETPAEPVNP
ncbi:sugar ABC transporter ATP-binding protein [Paracoccus pacificus]|uniref:Sugar ABC transporter ATP-binding protein n=1 Tax=Paracoccus pacificus TaxID=1463598 RepID=A0ABW4R9L8_9RHOB